MLSAPATSSWAGRHGCSQPPCFPPLIREHLGESERSYLLSVFKRYQGYPSLHQLWLLMDEQ